MAPSTTERQLRVFFFFTRLSAVIGFRLKQPRPHRERRAWGRGRRGCGRREGPEERVREGSLSSSQTKQKKDQKTEKRGRADRRFQEQSLHLQADCGLGIQIQCPPKTKAPQGSGGTTPGLGPHRGARTAGCRDGRGPCLQPHGPPAVCCSPCSRSPPRSPPSARPKAASAPK